MALSALACLRCEPWSNEVQAWLTWEENCKDSRSKMPPSKWPSRNSLERDSTGMRLKWSSQRSTTFTFSIVMKNWSKKKKLKRLYITILFRQLQDFPQLGRNIKSASQWRISRAKNSKEMTILSGKALVGLIKISAWKFRKTFWTMRCSLSTNIWMEAVRFKASLIWNLLKNPSTLILFSWLIGSQCVR